MPEPLAPYLTLLRRGRDLSRDEMRSATECLLSGSAQDEAMREFLVLLAEKTETADELTGAAEALRASMLKIAVPHRPVVDTCGTGGDGSQTFNISTAAALAIAACGVTVAKHGNRKVTSRTGSADVLAELGIDLEAAPEIVERCLADVGICFCFAPNFHPTMKRVGPVRRSIDHPTIFNRLGPLANPANADRQVLGVGAESLVDVMAGALQRLGTTRSIVVRGCDGVDEISLSGETRVLEVTPKQIVEHHWKPQDFGVEPADRAALYADDPEASAACIRSVFSGQPGACRDAVTINAAAGLWVAGVSPHLSQCAARVNQAIDSGAVAQLVQRLSAATHSNFAP